MSEETPIQTELVEITETVETVEVEKVVAPAVLPPASTIAPTIPSTTMSAPQSRLIQWWIGLFQKMSSASVMQPIAGKQNPFAVPMPNSAKDEAKNRLQLVLMHDRTRLSPTLMESMRDELVQVISKYVEIDKSALDLSLEQESNTIALVANISVVRPRENMTPPGEESAQAG